MPPSAGISKNHGGDASSDAPARRPVAPSEERNGSIPSFAQAGGKRNYPSAQAIDMKRAVANYLALPLLDPVRRRIYRDWLNGCDLAVLQIMYRDPVLGSPPRRALEHTVREMVHRERNGRAA